MPYSQLNSKQNYYNPSRPTITAAIAASHPPWVIVNDLDKINDSADLCGREGMRGIRLNGSLKVEICAYGFSIDDFRILQKKLEFNGKVLMARDGLFGSHHDNGENTGIVREIVENKADIALELMENKARATVISFQKPLIIGELAFIYVKADYLHDAGIFKPFDTNLWLGILASIICVIIFIWILERFSPYGVHKSNHRSIEDERSFNSFDSANYIWGTYFTGEIIVEKPTSFGSRATATIISMVAILLIAGYSGNLITYLIVLNETPPINGLFDERVSTKFIQYIYKFYKIL